MRKPVLLMVFLRGQPAMKNTTSLHFYRGEVLTCMYVYNQIFTGDSPWTYVLLPISLCYHPSKSLSPFCFENTDSKGSGANKSSNCTANENKLEHLLSVIIFPNPLISTSSSLHSAQPVSSLYYFFHLSLTSISFLLFFSIPCSAPFLIDLGTLAHCMSFTWQVKWLQARKSTPLYSNCCTSWQVTISSGSKKRPRSWKWLWQAWQAFLRKCSR